VLGAVIVALTLEGVLPGLGRPRRPVAVVRYDRVRESRIRANLRRIARRLSRHEPAECPAVFTDIRAGETRSAGAGTGARTVLFSGG